MHQLQQPVLRISLALFGLAGALWLWMVLPLFLEEGRVRDVVARILVSDRFQPGVLRAVLAQIEDLRPTFPLRPEQARSEALIRLRIGEDAMRRETSQLAENEVRAAQQHVEFALSLNPADAYLWLMLYSAETARSGFEETNIRFLDQSYATAPLEAWIALKRNRLALAIFPMLSDDTKQKTTVEFAGLVDSDFPEEAAIILTGVGWAHRERLLASLVRVDDLARQTFAKRLSRDGVKVSIPGVSVDERWWR